MDQTISRAGFPGFALRQIAATSWILLYCLVSAGPVLAQRTGILALRATYGERGPDITSELIWRVFLVRGTDAQLVQQSDQVRPSLALPAGEYAIHVSHGLATAIRQLSVTETGSLAVIPINAGGLLVGGHIGGPDMPLAPQRQGIRLFIPSANNSEARLVTSTLKAGTVLRLPEGTYHLVSTYTGTNSVIRSDVKIETGRITQASVNHRAASMTLKLVRVEGGVALAGTQWTIETPGGDIVAEAVGAFPTIDIAEGSYVVTARHNDRDFRGTMKVEGGLNRDFEIVVE
ncbi:hypothetical protein MCEMSEM23_00661 [Rhabdaerophilaceae bacterium]